MTRGTADVLRSVVIDLRGHPPLVDLLDHPGAIYQSWIADEQGFPAEVTVTPITAGSAPHRGVVEREYRVQITVKVTQTWRDEQDARHGTTATTEMWRILDRVADRLDRAPGIHETALGGEGGPAPHQMDDGRLAAIGDWRLAGWYNEPSLSGIDRGYANSNST